MPDESAENNSANTSQSGGINLAAQGDAIVGGDIVGRDKITGYTVEQVGALIAQLRRDFQPKPFDGRCPYIGLDSFDESNAEWFFGREALVNELIERIKTARAIVIAGPSGSGKSSLVRAGLIVTLKRGSLPGSGDWLYEVLTPGRNPLDELARVTSSLAGSLTAGDDIRAKSFADPTLLHRWAEIGLKDKRDPRAVIVVDQFEETFTQTTREAERVAFLNLLTYAATAETGRVIVLFAIRSDFVAACATYPPLNDLLNRQFLQVGAMSPDELVRAITLPALQVGLPIDPDLISQIISDMRDEPGALPLMQFALKDLCDTRQRAGGVIALARADYLAHGGLRKALERHADTEFAKLSAAEQQVAHSIFGQLIQVRRGPPLGDTRRTALFSELVPANMDAAAVEAVTHKLASARLITTAEQDKARTVTLAHEKLIEAWPWLRRLVDDNREAIALQNRIADDAQEWARRGRDQSYLYRGAQLVEITRTIEEDDLSLLQREFLRAGVEAGRRSQKRQRRLRLMLAATLGLLLLGAAGAFARPHALRYVARGERVLIPAGVAQIGTNDRNASSEEQPEWEIPLEAFAIDKYEVSNRQYRLCVAAGACGDLPAERTWYDDPDASNYPVVGVTAYQAADYCHWQRGHLPTELQWERVARGSTGDLLWPWGNDPPTLTPERANLLFDGQSIGPQPVISYTLGQSAEGVFNLVGNAWEWTRSFATSSYEGYDPALTVWDEDPKSIPAGVGLVQRGGSWADSTITRITRRNTRLASATDLWPGFRCVFAPGR